MIISRRLLLISTVLLLTTGCQTIDVQGEEGAGEAARSSHAATFEPPEKTSPPATAMVAMAQAAGMAEMMPELVNKRLLFVGETHDRYAHHLSQLQVIQGFQAAGVDFAIGMEFIQRPFQSTLDDYVAGRIDERQMLQQTEWFDRWRYDFRLYRPIFAFAREHGIPIIALNVSKELIARISASGLDGLSAQERAQLPSEIDQSDEVYKARLREIFGRHPGNDKRAFERFIEVQFSWDEGMAEQVADYLQQHPKRKMVVLAGAGHLMYGSGIPQRVSRRVAVDSAIVLPGDSVQIQPGIADYLIFPQPAQLPKTGVMGVLLTNDEAGVKIGRVVEGSAAEQQGIVKGDVIQRLDGVEMLKPTDIRIAMLNKSPGDRVRLDILRRRALWGDKQMAFEVTLR